jgi:signal peptidase I
MVDPRTAALLRQRSRAREAALALRQRGAGSSAVSLEYRHCDSFAQARVLRLWIGIGKLCLLLFVLYGLVFNFSVVRGSSMAPGIHDGDRILVNHISYLVREVRRGDVVVLHYPLDPRLDYIKRVIGLPGDHVRIEGETVYVNGLALKEPYIREGDPASSIDTLVGDGQCFVLGDNRRHSSDSRDFGLVPLGNLVGKVDVRVWPFDRAGWIE